MQEKLLTFLLHMNKLLRLIVCNHPVTTGLTPDRKKKNNYDKIAHFSFTYEQVNKTDSLQPSGCNGPKSR